MSLTREPLLFDNQHNCFGCGALNPTGMRLQFTVDPSGTVYSTVCLTERFGGPHGFVHGGIIATLLDEAMSKAIHAAAGAHKLAALTRKLETEYLRPTPLGATLSLSGRQERAEGRKLFCSAALTDADGQTLARGTALFIAIDRPPQPGR